MQGYNKVFLLGNLGGDPEQATTQSGIAKTRARLAENNSWKDKATGEWQERTSWHTLIAWRFDAEKLGKCQKGDTVFIEGELGYNKYTGKDGIPRESAEITVKKVLRVRYSEPAPAGRGEFAPAPLPAGDDDDDSLPF